jgi:hypothetical protein
MTERKEIIATVALYNQLLDEAELGSYPADEILAEFLHKFPGIDNYDSNGNYVGAVANENGWTP